MGSFRSINSSGLNFTLELGSLSCVMKTVIFQGNAADNGGAISFIRASLLQMDDIQFLQNKGRDGGAAYLELDGDSHPQIGLDPVNYVNGGGLLFEGNVAERGGAMYTYVVCGLGLDKVGISPLEIARMMPDGEAGNEDAVFIEGSKFYGNMASEDGGAWHANSGRVGCLGCLFSKNSVTVNPNGFGGAIFIRNQGALHSRNVTFVQNSALHGGAIYAEDSLIDIVGSVFWRMWLNNMVVGHMLGFLQAHNIGWGQLGL